MNCAEFESRLSDEFDKASTHRAAELAEHAAHCAACRATWEGFRQLADGIGIWRQETPDVDLAEAVVFALRQSAGPMPQEKAIDAPHSTISQQRHGHRWLALTVATSAALLIAVSLLPVFRRGAPMTAPVAQVPVVPGDRATSTSDNDQIGKNAVEQNRSSPPQVASRQLRKSATDGDPYYDLAQRAAGALGQMTMLVLPVEAAPHEPLEQPPAEGPVGWMDDFERELKPVGRSLGNAFDFLWRAGESADG